ncbi:MAG: CHC2 zinc finger domain-containing protein [bacterium]
MNEIEFRQVVDQIKNAVNILEVIGAHVELNSRNMGCCPFHEDSNPSFSVNPDGQYFHCFGCGKGGDVIRFVELIEGLPFTEAASKLAGLTGIPFKNLDEDQIRTMSEARQVADVLTATARYYHASLSTEAADYLRKDRGFTDEIIGKFCLGWAGGSLRHHLTQDCRFSMELCLRAGVLKETDQGPVRDYFYQRIIFPNWKAGRVVHLTGRTLDDKGPKYLHLPGSMHYLFTEDALRNEQVVLCEGAPDCITAVQAGWPAVSILGTSQFNESYPDRFRKCKSVYVCLDGDDAGRNAASRIGRWLPDKAIVVAMPDGVDINDYLMRNTPEKFQTLLDEGKRYLDLEIDRISTIPENRRMDEVREFLPLLFGLDDFDRQRYIDRVKREFKLNKKTIEAGVYAGKADKPDPPLEGEPEKEQPITDTEREQALELLRDPDLIEKIGSVLTDLGCVGEGNNKVIVYMALTSRILEHPISLIVKGESSAGKSYLVETVTKLFPEEDILKFTAITPKALFHRKGGLEHKGLIVFERPGAEESDYSIRSLQSEGKLLITMSIKDPETGEWINHDKVVPGPVAYIETTTQTHIHAENETRCFEIYIDESEEQTRLVHEAQKERFRAPGEQRAVDTRPWVVAQRILEPLPVIIDYIDLIPFPTKPLRVRRDHDRLLTLIEASATLHQHQRERRTIDGQEYLIAGLEDYVVAYSLATDVLQQTIKQITPQAEKLANLIDRLQGENGGQPITNREIVDGHEATGNTVKKYLRELIKQGVVEEDRSGKAHLFSILRMPDKETCLLVHPEELRRRFEAQQESHLPKPNQMPIGGIKDGIENDLTQPHQPTQGCEGRSNEL